MGIDISSNRAKISVEKNYIEDQGQDDIERESPVEVEETVPNCSRKNRDPQPRLIYTLRKFKEFLEELGPVEVIEIHLPWEEQLEESKIDLVSMAKEVFGEGSLGSVQFLRIHTFSLQQPFVPYLLENFDYKCLHVESAGPLTITEKMMNCEFLSVRAKLTNPERLKEFTGTGLLIRNGDENGFSSDFIMEIIKKWYQHEIPITEYVYVGQTHWTEGSRTFYEEKKSEEKECNSFHRETIFIREDGVKCLLHCYQQNHLELWFEPFDEEARKQIDTRLRPRLNLDIRMMIPDRNQWIFANNSVTKIDITGDDQPVFNYSEFACGAQKNPLEQFPILVSFIKSPLSGYPAPCSMNLLFFLLISFFFLGANTKSISQLSDVECIYHWDCDETEVCTKTCIYGNCPMKCLPILLQNETEPIIQG